jgi:molybdenum cofactor synthesis domain-containing protein
MNIELINTGAELLVGRVLNTHQQWLCRQLSDLGYEVSRQCCVPDMAAQIQAAIRESLARADLVITTGGLGPTSDDLTRDCIAQMLGRILVLHQPTLTWIEDYFASRKRPMPASTRVQAMVPEGATILPNPNGTAPGLAIPAGPGGKWLILLPGPPRELRPMFTASVVPILLREFPLRTKFLARTFKSTGLGESVVEEKIAAPLQGFVLRGLEIAYCARIGEVDVRLSARGPEAAALLEAGENIVRGLLGPVIFGTGDDSLESGDQIVDGARGKPSPWPNPAPAASWPIASPTFPAPPSFFPEGLSHIVIRPSRTCSASRRRPSGSMARSAGPWPAKWPKAPAARCAPITPWPSPASPGRAAALRTSLSAPPSSHWPAKRHHCPASVQSG